MLLRDRNDLSSFLSQAEGVLEKVVAWRELLFRRELRDPIAAAWDVVKTSFDTVRQRISSGSFDTPLDDAGLSGPQLVMKLTGFRLALADFEQWGTVKLLDKVLDWINGILKSIAAAIPGGEALVEFKEACEKAIETEGGRVIPGSPSLAVP